MDPDSAVGQRVAELRRQKGLRQEDFLELLEARGVGWTQATLSRVEGGKRALKATEAFAVADALGADVAQLNPAGGGLFYQIQSHRLKYREAQSATRTAAALEHNLRERLIALSLAEEIQSGRSEFTVHGSPRRFVQLVSQALSPEERAFAFYPYGDIGIGNVEVQSEYNWLTAIGIDSAEVQTEYNSLAVTEFGHAQPAGDDHFRLLGEVYRKVFARHLPSLKFADETTTTPFTVDGIDVGENTGHLDEMRDDGG
jgi:transcriptional regulator with XRE-family HTH domain